MIYPVALIVGLIVLTSLCDTVSQLCLKSSINALDMHVGSLKAALRLILRLARVPRVWVALAASVSSLFVWLFVLSKADLNFAFSLDSMHYIFIALGSMLFLKERISPIRWCGVLTIVIGIMLVSVS